MNISNAIYQVVTELQGLIAIDGTHRDNIPGSSAMNFATCGSM